MTHKQKAPTTRSAGASTRVLAEAPSDASTARILRPSGLASNPAGVNRTAPVRPSRSHGSKIKGARVDEKPALADHGIDKNLAKEARKTAALADEEFEKQVAKR